MKNIFTIMLVLIIPVILAASAIGCDNTKSVEEGNIMIPKGTIPIIDANKPVNIETATFALG